jgi:predicted TIM-barrel fold metal-dependent hydrolase
VNDGFTADAAESAMAPNIKHFNIERAAYDFLITCAFEKLFERHPGVRIASIENGAEFLSDLFRKLKQSRDRLSIAHYYKEDPGLLFKEHVWINPFWEDDVYEVEEFMGADRVIFGSDWPHIEGMPTPLDYVKELDKFDDAKKQRILRDNTRELNELRPA